MAHTQGPWIAVKHFAERHGGRTYIPIVRPGNDPMPIAVVHRDTDRYGKEEGEANVALIASAPDLLAALRGVLPFAEHEMALAIPKDYREHVTGLVNAALAAIAKATS